MKKLLLGLTVAVFLSFLGLRLYQELSVEGAAGPGSGGPGGNYAGGPMGFEGGRGPGARPVLLTETAAAAPYQFAGSLEVLGELQPQAEVEVMSRISGRLQQVFGDTGQPVLKGDLLAVVDDVDLQQQIRRAEASIAVARAGVNREEVTYRNLLVQVRRYQNLHEEALISTQELEDIESRLGVSEAQLELARAQVVQAEASLEELKTQQEQTRVYSPLTGFVGARHLDPGALVSGSVPIFSVLNVDRVKTIVPIAEHDLSRVRPGLEARVTVDAYPGRVHEGTITRISPSLNSETRTADVEIEIDNSDHALKPGMFARVRISSAADRTALGVPRSALLTQGGQQGVYLLSEGMTVTFNPIRVGRVTGEMVEVISGLEEGTEVVTSGAQSLNEGDLVQLAGESFEDSVRPGWERGRGPGENQPRRQ